MAWNYPGISLEELVKLLKGFVDIMILASGYQSTGRLAHWDSSNIKKAFHLACFLEQVVREMVSSGSYTDSVNELDAAIVEMKADPCFPQGLMNLSCDMLLTARKLVLSRFLHALPLMDTHLKASLTAVVEMDLDKLSESECDTLGSYLDKLRLQNVSELSLVRERRDLSLESMVVSSGSNPLDVRVDDFTKLTLQELSRRESGATCISMVETGLSLLSNAVTFTKLDESFGQFQLNPSEYPTVRKVEDCVDLMTFNGWKSRNLAYLLNNRTVRLVSGASLLFSATKSQWFQVFEQLNSSQEGSDTVLLETMELLLLGCIANRWRSVIEYFVSVSYSPLTISKLLSDVHDFLEGSRRFQLKEEEADPKVKEILKYLAELVVGQLSTFWKLSPVLAAAAMPCWSPLFRLYLGELNAQFIGNPSTSRCCSCTLEEHKNCQLAERIWTVYIFNILGSSMFQGGVSA